MEDERGSNMIIHCNSKNKEIFEIKNERENVKKSKGKWNPKIRILAFESKTAEYVC